jgi:hypothetical protein
MGIISVIIGAIIGQVIGSLLVLAYFRSQDGFWAFGWMQNIENKLKAKHDH